MAYQSSATGGVVYSLSSEKQKTERLQPFNNLIC